MLRVIVLAVALLAESLPAPLAAQDHQAHAHGTAALGKVAFENSGNAAAQPALQRGVALLHSFEYPDAIASFRDAQRADPSLAVAFWLEALAYSHVVWGYENLDASKAALAKLGATRDVRLAKARTPRERGFGRAIETFFGDGALADRTRLFADSMLALTSRESDHEVAAFAALASMWAWFSNTGAVRAKYNAPVKDLSLRIFRENNEHPGAVHYLIHFVDMNPQLAAEALEFARTYDRIAPDAEHALHMPSHVYLPLGMWKEVVASNERSWAASRREIADRRGPPEENSWHSLDWLQYSYLQLGRHAEARALVDTAYGLLRNTSNTHPSPDARNAVLLAAFRYGWETGKWDAFPRGIPDIEVVLSQPRANARSWQFATNAVYQAAVASLRANKDSRAVVRASAAFRREALGMPNDDPRNRRLVQLATQLDAMTAWQAGERASAVAMLERIAPEEPNNVTVPPTTIPSWELLGEYYLAMGRKRDAAAAFQKALTNRPNRAATLRGLEAAR